MRHFWDMG